LFETFPFTRVTAAAAAFAANIKTRS